MSKFFFEKTDEEKSSIKAIISERETKIAEICSKLFQSNADFNVEKTFEEIEKYINDHERFLYSVFSNYVFHVIKEEEEFGNFNHNIDLLFEHLERIDPNQYGKDDYDQIEKVMFKIYDHVNLAYRQFADLKETEDDFERKFKKNAAPFETKLTKELNAQLLTLISIFTALAFLIFGGLTSLENLFSNYTAPLTKIIAIGSVWGFCMINVIFVFLVCISKMTKITFETTSDTEANIFQRYSIVWWTDWILLSICSLSSWLYYVTKNGIWFWFDDMCVSYPQKTSIVGILVILGITAVLAKWLYIKIHPKKKRAFKKL